ncbi:Actin family [Dillenia turbinata]|uniref:Actin family n=1 Tax=Dillenia turbinata TaxID=194707 RepID=A0AAN8VGJ8_9MAGN
MPFISRTARQSDYSHFPSTCPIVIDNGGSYFRIGWAGETDPRLVFRNIVQRPRHKTTGETVSIVGDQDPTLLRYFDCTRSGPRSAFDSNVVYQFEIMEYILDFGFDRMGVDGSQSLYFILGQLPMQEKRVISVGSLFLKQVDHPVLITECVCNPIQSRSKMAELLFESYGVPSIAFGVDAAFSYKYNQQCGVCGEDGLAICSGFATSHAIPHSYIYGFPELLSLSTFFSLFDCSRFTWEKVEDLKMEHCYIAPDYASEVRLFQKGTKEAEEKTRCWQLPWVPPPTEEPRSEEEIARKAAIKERQGQRLREMAEAKRSSRINELENQLQGLEFLLQQLAYVQESDVPSFLAETGYVSKQEIESTLAKVTQSLRKAKGEQVESEAKADPSATEKFPLVNIPDEMLTLEQLKEKRKQLFLKTTTEGRQRAKQKRFEEEMERERLNQQDEEKRLENPELYLEQLQAKYKELSEKVEQRKRLKTNGGPTNGNHNVSGGVGRGERLNAAQKERMRLLTTAAFDRGKGEDTFGARDEDWHLYKLMSKDNDDDDEGPDEDEAELARVTSRLQVDYSFLYIKHMLLHLLNSLITSSLPMWDILLNLNSSLWQDIDPKFVPKSEPGPWQSSTEVPRSRPMTKEDFQILLEVERFRCPEILFQPNLIGIDQAGLDEMVGVSLRRLPSKAEGLEDRLTSNIFLTGGSCLYPGMSERLEAGIRMIRPCGSPIKIVKAFDPIFDAWRGAAAYANSLLFPQQTFTRMDYYEKGEDWLRKVKLIISEAYYALLKENRLFSFPMLSSLYGCCVLQLKF